MTGNMLTVTISRKFDASAEHVFDAWLDPDTARIAWFSPLLSRRSTLSRAR